MGGYGSGGSRPGSGRKGKPKGQAGVVLTMPERIGSVGEASTVCTETNGATLLVAPDGVSLEVQAIWAQWAPHAIAERTLSSATAAGFRQLCQHWVYVAALAKKIDHLGPDTKEATGYLLTYLKAGQRLDTLLARFKLTAFGKPAIAEKPKPKANPWAAVGGAS